MNAAIEILKAEIVDLKKSALEHDPCSFEHEALTLTISDCKEAIANLEALDNGDFNHLLISNK